jgi:hypothetical protein
MHAPLSHNENCQSHTLIAAHRDRHRRESNNSCRKIAVREEREGQGERDTFIPRLEFYFGLASQSLVVIPPKRITDIAFQSRE